MESMLLQQKKATKNKTKQNKTKQNKAKQNKTKQNKTKQNKTKQNKTKQNKTKQNKTKQNKNKTNRKCLAVTIGKQILIHIECRTSSLDPRLPPSFLLLAVYAWQMMEKWTGSREMRLVISASARKLSWLHLPQAEWASLQ